MYQASIIRIITHQQNHGYYKVLFKVGDTHAESGWITSPCSILGITQGQLLDYCNK